MAIHNNSKFIHEHVIIQANKYECMVGDECMNG
jgi:hypothetical protein